MEFTVKTNKVGEKNSTWAGKVGYRFNEIAEAYRKGMDLNCLCANEYPIRMLISHSDIYKRILYRRKFADKKYLPYELVYYLWQPNFNGMERIGVNKAIQKVLPF